jgi:hypothetical protein
MAKHWLSSLFLLSLISQLGSAQTLPKSLKTYLDRNYRGWSLAGECYDNVSENKRVLAGDFDGNDETDYAIKFVRGSKGFFMAFLANGKRWMPFYLHIWKDPDDAKFSDLILFDKGERYELGESDFKLKFDAPADFRCESDVGGVHTFRKGRFIAH